MVDWGTAAPLSSTSHAGYQVCSWLQQGYRSFVTPYNEVHRSESKRNKSSLIACLADCMDSQVTNLSQKGRVMSVNQNVKCRLWC